MRYCGKIGYRITRDAGHGVWKEELIERTAKGDVLKVVNRNQQGESINDNFTVSNSISIIADPFALSNFTSIIYCVWLGVKWKVSSVDASQRPRLILSLGGEYNE